LANLICYRKIHFS